MSQAQCGGVASSSGRSAMRPSLSGRLCWARQPYSCSPSTQRCWNFPAPGDVAVAAVAAGRHTAVAAAAAVPAAEQDDWIEVGYITMPHGVYGEMKVQPLTDAPEERLGEPGTRWLQAPALKLRRRQQQEAPREVALEYGRPMISKGQEVWLVKLEGIETPEDAALLKGHRLLIQASARPPLQDEDEFYVTDLVGLRVFLQSSGEELGTVIDIFDGTGTYDLLKVQLLTQPEQQQQAQPQQQAAAEAGAETENAEEPGSAREASREVGQQEEEEAEPRYFLIPFAKAMVPVVELAAGRMEISPPPGLIELATTGTKQVARTESRGRRQRRRQRPRGQRGSSSEGEQGSQSASDA